MLDRRRRVPAHHGAGGGDVPGSLRLEVDGQTLPVVPLAGVELLDAESAEVLARARALYSAQDERASAAENAS